jgi:hypothetical protein
MWTRYSLKGWTDFVHMRYYLSITDQCSVNMNIPAQETGGLPMDPKEKMVIFSKASPSI